MKKIILLLWAAALCGAGIFQGGALPAFPGAEGFGADTVHGRGGRVIYVTSLEARGAGTLREALGAEGPRIILFKIGGTIRLRENIVIREPFAYVAGQSAPGDGVAIYGAGIIVATHDVVIRFLRVRPGDDPAGPPGASRDALAVHGPGAYNVVIDHCSLSWAIDENASTWGRVDDVTFQWNLIAEGLHDSLHPEGPHSKGLLIGDGTDGISVHHNLFAHNNARNPLLKGGTTADIVQNVMYNWGDTGLALSDWEATGAPIFANVTGNVFRRGPNSPVYWPVLIPYGRVAILGIDLPYLGPKPAPETRLYLAGNTGPYRPDDSGDEWALVNIQNGLYRSDEPFPAPAITPTGDTYARVLEWAGAVLPTRDAADRRIVADVQNRTGRIIDAVAETPGYPDLQSADPPADSDLDGMPDAWESARDLDPDNPADGPADRDGDGYTNVEEYLNGLVEEIAP